MRRRSHRRPWASNRPARYAANAAWGVGAGACKVLSSLVLSALLIGAVALISAIVASGT